MEKCEEKKNSGNCELVAAEVAAAVGTAAAAAAAAAAMAAAEAMGHRLRDSINIFISRRL